MRCRIKLRKVDEDPIPIKGKSGPLPTRTQIFGDNSRSHYGSNGMSSTPAFGNDYKDYYYHVIDVRVEEVRGDTYYAGLLIFWQERTMVQRFTRYYRLTYTRDGTLIKEEHLYTQIDQDFEAKGVLSGKVQKEAFSEPNPGWGDFYTDFIDELGGASISIGTSIGGGKPGDPEVGTVEFFVHQKSENAIKAKERVEQEIKNRERIDVATDVRKAISNLSDRLIKTAQIRSILESVHIPLPRSDNLDVELVDSTSDSYAIQAIVQLGGTDLLAVGADNASKVINVYNQVADRRLNMSLISTSNRSFSIQHGKMFTSEYLMQFSNEAINLPVGTYEVVDIDIIDIKDTDEYGNPYSDPEYIYTNVPAASIIIYLHSDPAN